MSAASEQPEVDSWDAVVERAPSWLLRRLFGPEPEQEPEPEKRHADAS